jgi:hypothetical protein
MGLAYRICKKFIRILDGILLGNWEVEVPIAFDYSLLGYNTMYGRWLLMFHANPLSQISYRKSVSR